MPDRERAAFDPVRHTSVVGPYVYKDFVYRIAIRLGSAVHWINIFLSLIFGTIASARLRAAGVLGMLMWAGVAHAQSCEVSTQRFCEEADTDTLVHVCVKVCDDGTRTLVRVPAANTITASQRLEVIVAHKPELKVTMTVGGERGRTEPQVNNQTTKKHNDGVDHSIASTTTTAITAQGFAARKAGRADVLIKVIKGNTTISESTIEIDVAATYWGAARLGLAWVVGKNIGRKYETRTIEAGKDIIVESSNPGGSFEFVMGFAPYLIDLFVRGGRTIDHSSYVAPYLGFGLVGMDDKGKLDALTSFHMGLEFEFARDFSLAATATWRRSVTHLVKHDNVALGKVAPPDNENYTWERSGWGFGIVINATPELLSFAR